MLIGYLLIALKPYLSSYWRKGAEEDNLLKLAFSSLVSHNDHFGTEILELDEFDQRVLHVR